MDLPPFSATGIGSLPYPEPGQALDLVFRTFPALPHWPQLPGRGTREGMVYQFLTPLLETGLLVIQGDKARFATSLSDWPQRLTGFYTLALAAEAGDREALEHFTMPRAAATGFYAFTEELERRGTDGLTALKGQIAGPLTAAFFLKDERGRAAYYDDQLRDLVVRTLALAARRQADMLSAFGRPVLLFIDDPGMNVFGRSSYITVTREMILEDFGRVAEAIRAGGAFPGLHSCDAVDWSIPFQLPLAVVSLDCYNYFSSLFPFSREIKDYLARGGLIAWGIVPTFGPGVGKENAATLASRLDEQLAALANRGLDIVALVNQSMVTPACGTGLLSPGRAEEIYRLTASVARMTAEAARC
ncbi:MAG: hypothetical protein M0Z41_15715 [Peptococcaceae bacterium]|jgi:hypothetical protein|nr:hypothetical protein [Peptococcaceae bacterium]